MGGQYSHFLPVGCTFEGALKTLFKMTLDSSKLNVREVAIAL